jgi:hypothetical protein
VVGLSGTALDTGANVRRLKVAVVGTGFRGRVHLEALRRVEYVDGMPSLAGRCRQQRNFAPVMVPR